METIIVTVITSLGVIINTYFTKRMDNKRDDLEKKIESVAIANCKNFLVSFLANVERGFPIDEVEKKRFYEEYDAYVNQYKQNSYIHDKVEKLKKEGKL